MILVPNSPPTSSPGALRLAVIGECPGIEEENWAVCPQGHEYSTEKWDYGQRVRVTKCPMCSSTQRRFKPTPFVGASGYLLNDCLKRAGLRREQVFVGNVSRLHLSEPQFNLATLADHLDALDKELVAFKPNCVLLLGNQALRAFHPWHWQTVAEKGAKFEDPRQLEMFSEREVPRVTKKGSKCTCKVSDWRGSIFESDVISPGGGKWKCVAAYHPAACLRQRDWIPVLRADVKRAIQESADPALNLPHRKLVVPSSAAALVTTLDMLRSLRKPLSFDVEGYPSTGVTICSFAHEPDEAYVVPLRHIDLRPWWAPSDETVVMTALRALLEDPLVPKIGHNLLYELFIMRWCYGIKIQGIGGDTMMKWHELYAEMDKALEVPASLLTRQPYWKFGREAQTDDELIAYNAIDTCVTLELDRLMEPHLTVGEQAHYQFNKTLLEPMSEQMFRGLRFDSVARDALICKRQYEVYDLQGQLDRLAAIKRPTLEEAAEQVCLKAKLDKVQDWGDLARYAKQSWREKL